jgi:putative transposase
MDSEWCKQTLEDAIESHGKPEILNTDLGSQVTSITFSSYFVKQEIRLSTNGKGRCIDNVFIEQL